MERLINILLVEDDQLDVIDIRRSLDKMKIFYRLHVAKNGEDALELLNGESQIQPDVVLVDINMPKMNGFEFLSIIRNQERWKDLKSFIITTSDEKIDRETAKQLGVSGYIIKPLKLNNATSLDAFNLMIDLINMK